MTNSVLNPRDISIDGYDYPLPEDRIAPHPLSDRAGCKLLRRKADGRIEDLVFKDLPRALPSDAMLVYNDTKVIHARLRFKKSTGAAIEVFCLEPENPRDYAVAFASTRGCVWKCLVGNAKKWKPSEPLTREVCLPDGRRANLKAEMQSRSDAAFVIAFSWTGEIPFADVISSIGEIPIPPYLNRSTETSDETDYQTVYAAHDGSVAAPTAGLHFTDDVLSEIDARGVARRRVTLHVGAGTFRPVKSETLSGHDMHAEFISVPLSLIEELASTDRKIYAVGTTTVRTLESLYQAGRMACEGLDTGVIPQWYAYEDGHPPMSRAEALGALAASLREKGLDNFTADTRIIIAPPYNYMVVDGLVTNFHQPKSTLLLLVSAMIGDGWREVYDHALKNGYRFLSYGDACLFQKA